MNEKEYHVALSFAGEDREYVEEVATILVNSKITVYYDEADEVKMWGKDLYSYFTDIYKNKSSFAIMFISKYYRDKLWTDHERKAMQARAFEENKEYILPARFDNTEIPGVLPTTGYIDLTNRTPAKFADLIIQKLTQSGVLILTENNHISTKTKNVPQNDIGNIKNNIDSTGTPLNDASHDVSTYHVSCDSNHSPMVKYYANINTIAIIEGFPAEVNSCKIMDAIAQNPEGMSADEIASISGMTRSNSRRWISTFVSSRMLITCITKREQDGKIKKITRYKVEPYTLLL